MWANTSLSREKRRRAKEGAGEGKANTPRAAGQTKSTKSVIKLHTRFARV